MGRHFQTSFAGGELDPTLHERIDLEKYKSALATARNVLISKTGGIVSRHGRRFIGMCSSIRANNAYVNLIPTPWGLLELGSTYDSNDDKYYLYYLIHDREDNGAPMTSHSPVVTELEMPPPGNMDELVFQVLRVRDQFLIYITDGEISGLRFLITYAPSPAPGFAVDYADAPSFLPVFDDDIFDITSGSSSGTGYLVDHMFTMDFGYGEVYITGWTQASLPVMPGQEITFKIGANPPISVPPIIRGLPWSVGLQQMFNQSLRVRAYRRPTGGGAYGYIGDVTDFDFSGSPYAREYTFKDVGAMPDYSHSIPENLFVPVPTMVAACVHQQKLVLSSRTDLFFSQTGKTGNFLRRYPLSDDSAIKVVTNHPVRHIVSKSGLLLFCDDGLYFSSTAITPFNSNFSKQGDWVCSSDLPPLTLSDSVLFLDEKENVVREISWDDTSKPVTAVEVSIFSDHLFNGVKLTSWEYKDGEHPVIYASFSNGTGAAFTYMPENKMRAWTRIDHFDKVKRFIGGQFIESRYDTPRTKMTSDIYALVEDGDALWIEQILDRQASAAERLKDPEYDKGVTSVNMDSFVSWRHLLLDDFSSGSGSLSLTPVTLDEWASDLTLSSNGGSIFTDPGLGEVGTLFKWFNPEDRTEITLEVTSRSDDDTVVVQPSEEFPSSYALNPRLYECKDTFTGLEHLEGKNVSVLADGYVVASPLNDIENYPIKTVVSGSITLDERYAIVHIGLPVVNDVETLDITETGQGRGVQYTRLESITCNKVYVKTKDTRGLHVGNRFPSDDALKGDDIKGTNMVEMDGFDSYDVNYEDENPIVGNRYDQPTSKRVEMSLPGDWKSRGRVCFRNVDPIHFEILSITPDIEIAEG